MAENKVSSVQRAQNFAAMTRQNIHMMASKTVTGGGRSISFEIPKTRYLASTVLRVDAKIKISHSSKTTIPQDALTPYRLLRRCTLDFNNGFQPFSISGEGLAIYNMINLHPALITPSKTGKTRYSYCPDFVVSADGTLNDFSFTIEMQNTLNSRDPIGLYIAQNPETVIRVTLDLCNGVDMFKNAEGYTVEIGDVTVSALTETFSIPNNENCKPDVSVLKLVTSKEDAIPSAGQQALTIPTGTIYRKLLFMLTDENGLPLADTDLIGNIELKFNTADCNYSISPTMLRVMNEKTLGYPLPAGVYCFDFSNGGSFPNYGGMRDYVDSGKLTEMTMNINTTKRGKCLFVFENISLLQ